MAPIVAGIITVAKAIPAIAGIISAIKAMRESAIEKKVLARYKQKQQVKKRLYDKLRKAETAEERANARYERVADIFKP